MCPPYCSYIIKAIIYQEIKNVPKMNTVGQIKKELSENKQNKSVKPVQNLLDLSVPWLFIFWTKLKNVNILALTLSLPNLAESKFRPNFQISFCEILKNK